MVAFSFVCGANFGESNGSWFAGSQGLFAGTIPVVSTMAAVRCHGLVELWSHAFIVICSNATKDYFSGVTPGGQR